MPEISLLSCGKRYPPAITHDILYAIMTLPTDGDSLASYLALVFLSPHSDLVKDFVTKRAKTATGGTIAGEVFRCVLRFKVHRPQDASINKGAFLVSRKLLESGRDVPSNVDRVHKFWVKFRPAAHIWAAKNIVENAGLLPYSLYPSESEMVAQNKHIIQVADFLLSKAQAVGWNFDPNPWKLVDANSRKSTKFDIEPPTSKEIELLKTDYHAPVKPK